MTATPESNRRLGIKLKEKYGVDENGKSLFHRRVGAMRKTNKGGYFRVLKERGETEKLHELAVRAGNNSGKAKRAKDETSNIDQA